MRRRFATLTVVPLLLLGAAACGEDQPADPETPADAATTGAGEGVPGLEITGEVGTAPEVEIDGSLDIDETVSEVVVPGEGAEVVEGEQALLHIYVANGSTGEKAATTYDEPGQPAVVEMTDGQIFGAVLDAVVGQPVGTRVAVAAVPEDAYGDSGNADLGLGKDDSVLFVVDVMSVPPSEVLDGPEGAKQDVPKNLPEVVEEDGKVTALSFKDAPARPANELQVVPLVEGDGPPVRDGSFVTFDYLGQVYGTDNVFDQSYTKEPITFAVGVNQLIKGWDEGLVGVNQGSRVMIIAPPEYGYGEQGNPGANIKGTDTLVFVVDVLGVG